MKKFLYLDVEYANSKNKSICQIGLLSEDFNSGEPVFPEKNIYVNPEDDFQELVIKVHGITYEKVKNEPNFKEVWESIKHYFKDTIVIGYNVANSDLSALVKTCNRYQIELPKIEYIDVYRIVNDVIPCSFVENFTLKNLCEYFNIDTGTSHNAFDDACATSDLFKCLIEEFDIDYTSYIKEYSKSEIETFTQYVSDKTLKSSMVEFYGIIQGFGLDKNIQKEEENFIKEWLNKNSQYRKYEDLSLIFSTLDDILQDGKITLEEMNKLKTVTRKYYNAIQGSPITNSLQELRGILKGIVTDKIVATEEGTSLINWMYSNLHLSSNYPFNEILELFENALKDGEITKQESDNLVTSINSILNPIQELCKKSTCVLNKHICLSGDFKYGKKSEVEKIISERGGIIDSSLKKTTDILIVGDGGSQSYAHGSYGTKIRKAMEYNQKGGNISIIKEKDFFS